MEKNMQVSILLDFYGQLLKDKVRVATEMYYNDDLSLSEIATDMGITRQGVRDLIKRAEQNLYSYEEKLGLHKRFINTEEGIEKLKVQLRETKSLINSNMQNDEINQKIMQMEKVLDELTDDE